MGNELCSSTQETWVVGELLHSSYDGGKVGPVQLYSVETNIARAVLERNPIFEGTTAEDIEDYWWPADPKGKCDLLVRLYRWTLRRSENDVSYQYQWFLVVPSCRLEEDFRDQKVRDNLRSYAYGADWIEHVRQEVEASVKKSRGALSSFLGNHPWDRFDEHWKKHIGSVARNRCCVKTPSGAGLAADRCQGFLACDNEQDYATVIVGPPPIAHRKK